MNVFDVLSYKGNYSSLVVYSVGSVVTYGGVNYVSFVEANSGHQPDTGTSYWASLRSSDPQGVGPLGPKETRVISSPVTLSSDSSPVVLVSVTLDPGVYKITSTIGNIDGYTGGSGEIATVCPFILVSAKEGKYEGIFALLGTSPSTLEIITSQGPGVSEGSITIAEPITVLY